MVPGSHRIFSASAVVVVLGLLGNALSLFKEQWVAYRFGVSNVLDIFSIGLALPLFSAGLIGSAISAVIVPSYISSQAKNDENNFAAEFGKLYIFFIFFTSALTASLSWFLMPYLASGFDQAKLDLARKTALALSPLIALQSATSLNDGILNARGQYVYSSLSTALIPIGTIGALILCNQSNVWLLCGGLYLGFLIKFIFQLTLSPAALLPAFISTRSSISLLCKKHHSIIYEFFALLASSTILGLMPIIGQSYAATLSPGTVSSLAYANKLIGIGLALLSSVINAIVFPILAQYSAYDREVARKQGTRWAWLIILIGLALLPITYLILEPIVRIIFEHGAFTEKDTENVTHILRYFLPHIPFYAAGLILARLAISLGLSRIFILGNIISLLIYWLSCEILVDIFGVSGIGISLTAVYIVSSIYLHRLIHRK